jgi:dihydrofolate reductase
MRKLIVFNSVTLDGYFTDLNGDMSWAHRNDEEWNAFVEGNASGGGVLLFGRITYQMMAGWWPTEMAIKAYPAVARQMNCLPKVVFSRTLDKATWNNTTLVNDNIPSAIRRMKSEPGQDMVIFGSGTIISQLTQERLIDEYQVVIVPVVIGSGKSMFDGVRNKLDLKLAQSRVFRNGNVFLCYEPT